MGDACSPLRQFLEESGKGVSANIESEVYEAADKQTRQSSKASWTCAFLSKLPQTSGQEGRVLLVAHFSAAVDVKALEGNCFGDKPKKAKYWLA